MQTISHTDSPKYNTADYADYCAEFPFHYYSPSRPVGSWLRPGVEHALVQSANGYGYVYTKTPMAVEMIESYELVAVNDAAQAALTNQEAPMNAETTTAAETLATRADRALADFTADATVQYDSMAEQLAELIAGLHVLATNGAVDWKRVIASSAQVYAATTKSAKTPKTPKAPAAKARPVNGTLYRISVAGPDGEIVKEANKPFAFAVLVHGNDGVWFARSWYSTKMVAYQRSSAARQLFPKDDVVIFSTTVLNATDAAELAEIEATPEYAAYEAAAEAEAPAAFFAPAEVEAPLPFEPEGEIERETEIVEPMHVKIVGGTAVHLSDDGDNTYCGLGRNRSYMQVETEVSCKNCKLTATFRNNAA